MASLVPHSGRGLGLGPFRTPYAYDPHPGRRREATGTGTGRTAETESEADEGGSAFRPPREKGVSPVPCNTAFPLSSNVVPPLWHTRVEGVPSGAVSPRRGGPGPAAARCRGDRLIAQVCHSVGFRNHCLPLRPLRASESPAWQRVLFIRPATWRGTARSAGTCRGVRLQRLQRLQPPAMAHHPSQVAQAGPVRPRSCPGDDVTTCSARPKPPRQVLRPRRARAGRVCGGCHRRGTASLRVGRSGNRCPRPAPPRRGVHRSIAPEAESPAMQTANSISRHPPRVRWQDITTTWAAARRPFGTRHAA